MFTHNEYTWKGTAKYFFFETLTNHMAVFALVDWIYLEALSQILIHTNKSKKYFGKYYLSTE